MRVFLCARIIAQSIFHVTIKTYMRIHKSILIALIIVVCSAAYFNTLFFNFVCDDNSLIVDNPYIRAFKFLPLFFTHDIWNISIMAINSGYYRPLLAVSFMLDYALWYETANASPENATAHFLLGNIYSKANIFDKAIEEYNITLKLNPSLFYDVFNNLGHIYIKKGLIDEAIKVYEIAASGPGIYRAISYNNLASVYNKKGQYKEAIEASLAALKYNPYLNDAHYNLALSYSGIGLIEKAISEYEEYLKVNPEYYGAHVDVGHLYYKKGDFQKAKSHWQAALKISKDYQPAKDALNLLGN